MWASIKLYLDDGVLDWQRGLSQSIWKNRWKLILWQQQLSCGDLIRPRCRSPPPKKKPKTKNSLFGVPSLSMSPYSPVCLYLSSNDPSSFPCCKQVHVTNLGRSLMALLSPFVLGKATAEQLVNVVHMADWAECIRGFWRDAAAAEVKKKKTLCVNSCSLATSHIKRSWSVDSCPPWSLGMEQMPFVYMYATKDLYSLVRDLIHLVM